MRLLPNSIHYSPSDTSERERERGGGARKAREQEIRKRRGEPDQGRKRAEMGAKSGEVYTSRAMQRERTEQTGNIGNPRRESENERGMPSSLYRSPPETVLVGGFTGVEGELPHWVVLVMLGWWQQRRWWWRWITCWDTGDTRRGRGGRAIFPSERGNRGKERSVAARERRNGG